MYCEVWDEQVMTTAINICVYWGDAHSGRSGGKIEVEGKVRKKEKDLRRKIPCPKDLKEKYFKESW